MLGGSEAAWAREALITSIATLAVAGESGEPKTLVESHIMEPKVHIVPVEHKLVMSEAVN